MSKRSVLTAAILVAIGLAFTVGWIVHQPSPSRLASPSTGVPTQTPSRGGVPDVTGLALGEAVRLLGNVGMRVESGSLEARRDAVVEGVVLSQGVPAGTPVGIGQSVPLVLSAGAHPHPISSPGGLAVIVGGTCDLLLNPSPSPGPGVCVGGPLFVTFKQG